eukprot:IDg17934t1
MSGICAQTAVQIVVLKETLFLRSSPVAMTLQKLTTCSVTKETVQNQQWLARQESQARRSGDMTQFLSCMQVPLLILRVHCREIGISRAQVSKKRESS